MTEILVERHWDTPLTEADLLSAFSNAAACLNIHRVDWSGSLLSADGQNLFCHFSAVDAESVRIALQQSGSPRGLVWAGTVHDVPGFTHDMLLGANVLAILKFAAAVAPEEIPVMESADADSVPAPRVKWVRAYLSADRQRMAVLYQAPDAESVSRVLRDTGMPVERVSEFRQFRPSPTENNAASAPARALPRWFPRWVQRLLG